MADSLELLRERLPSELLAEMRFFAGDGAWHFRRMREVIEACRMAGLISLGGNLHVAEPEARWESPNAQVSVYLDKLAQDRLIEESAAAGLRQFRYWSEAELIEEGLRGYPELEKFGDKVADHLFYSWLVRAER